MAAGSASADVLVVGASHRSSAAATRDRLFMDDAANRAFLAALSRGGVDQAAVLSTCARTEVLAVGAGPAAARTIAALLADRVGTAEAELAAELYVKRGEEAVRHLFRVASALDSPVIGEAGIAGQIRDGHVLAQAAGMSGAGLEALLDAAFAAARRVRNETAIGRGPVSMAAAARRLARDVHGDLAGCVGLMLIGGDTGELIADHILASGLGGLTIAARLPARAEAAARRRGCHHAPLEILPELLARSDVVVSAFGTGRHVLTADLVGAALRARRRKPMVVFDAAVPGDVAPDVDALEDAFVYGLADLERIAESGLAGRGDAAAEAEAIVDRELARHVREAWPPRSPAAAGRRARFEAVRAEILARHRGATAEEATRRLVDRLLETFPADGLDPAAAGKAGPEEDR